mmetsp:Transcript_17126/g.34242  ORF Transcript_17126/g.34242 Transcript_17126/m.34242 type:complete len:389 (+) Transcript_17126:50-1216(+)
MINNQAGPFHYHHVFDDEDNLTVQVSDANSLLGTHLLEGDWEEALDYLDTPEGQRDATTKNDPLGLFNVGKKLTLPKTKNGALFAALYVRAPFPLIKKICDIEEDTDISNLMYALSVIPHEEQQRLEESQQRKIPYRTRYWTNNEHTLILNLFLKECLQQKSSLLDKCPSWIIPSTFAVTPLAMAAYNPDVPSSILQKLCMLEPKAIGMESKLFSVSTIPLIVAAASPVPPATFPIDVRDEVKRNRWEKVKLLMNKDWFEIDVQSSSLDDIIGDALPSPPAITLEQVKVACDEAMKRKEWELVRELLKQFNSTAGDELTMSLSSIQTALAQHDRKVSTKLRKQDEKRNREEWLHRNMGLVMYPVDALLDLINAVIPQRHDDSLVSPMS